MMYKIMVVDDEALSRKTIVKMIDELGLQTEVIAEAKHGEEALQLIQINKPHIVVTDMNMPVMNGQQFLETLYREFSEIRVIVISGYSQFEYLKAALTFQACEYVLKPVAVAELRGALTKAIEAVSEYSSRQQERKSSREMMKLRREDFLQHVANKRITNKFDIQSQAEELGLAPALSADGYRVAVCVIRQFKEIARIKFHGNADLFMFCLENIMYELLPQEEHAWIYKSDDRFRLCLILPVTSFHKKRTEETLLAFHKAVHQTLGGDVAVGISAEFGGLEKLPEAYGAAIDAYEHNRFAGNGLTVRHGEAGERASGLELLASFDLKRLGQAFGSGKAKDMRGIMSDFVRKLGQHAEASIRDVHRELFKIRQAAISEMNGIAAAEPALFEPQAVEAVLSPLELRSFLDRLASAAEDFSKNRDMPESVQIVRQIAQYMDEHYFEDIGLIDIATRHYMDPAYLSKLFKAVTDENFIEYLTRKRMEKACELLCSPERKVNEIAELVGYENQRYFSQVFKKFTGRTPSEYREAFGQL
ncbi:response regulator [Paenibacillus gorillae]|uniref:response regulator n=1 Tax=Paenibacillus gorillae TaxID=1243662 RepID=UPI0009DE7229|nr:response regulator [Paenibacillus gorillae]